MTEDSNNIIVNLNVLSKLEPNKKLITKENYLNVEKDGLIPESLKRSWRGDSRDETIKKLETIIGKAIGLKDNNETIKDLLVKCKLGLNNLKQTYSTCELTKARIDSILLQIDN